MTAEMHHCFPRLNTDERKSLNRFPSRVDSDWYFELSKLVLRAILEYGLLLCREAKTVFSEPTNLTGQHGALVNQIRACLTYSDAKLLTVAQRGSGKSHIDSFGDISVSVPLHVARSLGALPCHYYSAGVKASDEPSSHVAARISENQYGQIRHLTQARDILHILAILEARCRELEEPQVQERLPTQSQVSLLFSGLVNATPEQSKKLKDAAERVRPSTAKEIVDLFNFRRFPILNLAWKVDGILDSLQTLDSSYRKSELEYFRQDEWRIPLAHHSNIILSCLDLSFDPFNLRTDEERSETQAAQEYINEILVHRFDDGRTLSEPKDYWLLWGSKYRVRGRMKYTSFAEMISNIYCPALWRSEISSLVDEVWRTRELRGAPPMVLSWEELTQ